MGNSQSIQKINFEDIQYILKNPESNLLINTLPDTEQLCLLPNTIHAGQEEIIINKYLNNGLKNIRIIIYGRNCNDETVNKKYQQLNSLGFYNIFVYLGGLFEWLLLQDIYGSDLFPTTKKEVDLLKYKPLQLLRLELLEY
jgi:hypothetical protein